jgi:hypothetical protein
MTIKIGSTSSRDDYRRGCMVPTISSEIGAYLLAYFGAVVLGNGSRLPLVARGLIEFSA